MKRYWNNLPIRVKVLIVLAVPIAPLLASAAFVITTARREQAAEQRVTHTLEVKAQIATTLAMTDEAEGAVQSFLLTRRKESLEPLMAVGARWPRALEQLLQLVSDNPDQVTYLRAMGALKNENPLVRLVQYGQTHPSESVPPDVLAHSSQVIGIFRQDLAGMQGVEDRLLIQRSGAARQAQRQVQLAAVGGLGAGLLAAVVAAFAFAGGITQRIERVRKNAELLAEGADLLDCPQEHSDEIGALAHGIHDASALLKAREGELRDRMSELGVVNQELEAFSYSVSHDLRAPLRHITGFAAFLEKSAGDKLGVEDLRHLKTITDAATRMGRLIDDLLSFSRMGRTVIAKRHVRLDDMVRDARHELAAERPQVSWTIHQLPEVEGDPALLKLVFVNLIGNALKYTRERQAAAIEIGTNGHGPGEVVVFVRDNGVGFDMQYAHKLFGVFQRLHGSDQFEGTGIGLAHVRRIIHRHGGRTWAEGALDEGATFYFSLPDQPAAARSALAGDMHA